MFFEGVMNGQVSTGELERRWKRVRAAMKERDIDVLVGVSASDALGGHVRYLTDTPSGSSYPTSLIFPCDDDMTIVIHGSYRGDKTIAPQSYASLRGVKRILTTPSFLSVGFTKTYEAEMIDQALAPYRNGRVGIIAPAQISAPTMDYLLKNNLKSAEIVDATDFFDAIKAVKSDEEVALVRRLATLQDEAVRRAFEAVRPGMEERQISSVADQYMRSHGSEQGILMSGSGPIGTPSGIRVPFMQGRKVQAGEQYHLLLEVNSQEGFFTELGRTCVLGKVPDQMKEEFELVLELRQVTLDMLRPGTRCKDIWEAHNVFMREHGLSEEKRLYSHSQGYDLVERPLVRWDEDMALAENMTFAVHPMISTPTSFTWICDNYLIRKEGPPERLHKFEEAIVEIG
jgi:Xaa-Pro aminopeptidase